MRFNPHAFKRANGPDAVSTGVVTAAIAATSADTLPESAVPSSVVSLSPALAAFIAAYGRPGANQITVPEGSLAVTLSLKFNDSAPQVDHFDYHASLGCPTFLVLLVKKQGARPRFGAQARFAQTEHLARKALALCPELQALDWQWKSEKYGGGHGNYLISSPIELPAAIREVMTVRTTFGGQPVTRAFWEIQFATVWRGTALQLWPHKHYGDHPPETDFSNGRHDSSLSTLHSPIVAAWRLNERLLGVEIHFTRRPDDATLAPLRADRAWRYTGKSKCWYARQTDATVAWAKAFCEHFNGAPVSDPASPIHGGTPSPSLAGAGDVPSRGSAARMADEGSVEKLIPPPSTIMPRLSAEAYERRPERKIIRFTDTGHEGIGSSRGIVRELNPTVGTWTPVPAAELAAERECLSSLVSLPSLQSQSSIADLMRPKV